MDAKQVYAAFVKAQAQIEKAVKGAKNPHFRSTYADLGSVIDAIKPVLAEHGLAYLQRFHDCEDGVAIETIIIHESGETLSNGILKIPVSRKSAQDYGSAITYGRRYSLQSAFGVAAEDDDGNAASRQPAPIDLRPALKEIADAATVEQLHDVAMSWVDKVGTNERAKATLRQAYSKQKAQLEATEAA